MIAAASRDAEGGADVHRAGVVGDQQLTMRQHRREAGEIEVRSDDRMEFAAFLVHAHGRSLRHAREAAILARLRDGEALLNRVV